MINVKTLSCATLSLIFLYACTSGNNEADLQEKVTGLYASERENSFDYFKDTLEIKTNQDGNLDITIIANWSSAKEDDPKRPKNKVAGEWNNYGKGETSVGELQSSDTTIRIAHPMYNTVDVLKVDLEAGTLEYPTRDGAIIYQKVR
ncbi:hypothetical protein ACR776_09175 [Sphingobacterium spiritivorum]|uniref:hypothetical protein n=1 Tax=Sphingobacterium spiritivorum TaxID=258 RepID=UPI003DA1D80B